MATVNQKSLTADNANMIYINKIKFNIGGYIMKNLINRILDTFKRKDDKEFHFNDIYRVCMSASEELGYYCKLEGYGRK